tara:strand:- start:1950 stop:2135 length:186 start_codon:yes stop_codon:yes gene_type:complete
MNDHKCQVLPIYSTRIPIVNVFCPWRSNYWKLVIISSAMLRDAVVAGKEALQTLMIRSFFE